MIVSQNIINSFIIISLMASYILLSGCSPSTHEWQARGDDLTVIKDASKISVLKKEFYCHISAQYRETTVQILEKRECLPVTNEEVLLWCSDFQPPKDRTLKPYLVRGVVYGYPSYTVVRFDQNTGELINHHATWDGENILGTWAMGKPYPWPSIIYLPSTPKTILPTAVLGGDWIFRGRDFKTLDTRSVVQEPNEPSSLKRRN